LPPKTIRKRADVLLAERGLAESREQAQALIMEGLVYAPTGRVLKAGTALPDSTPLEVRGRLPYVSRGGLKLAQALDAFALSAPAGSPTACCNGARGKSTRWMWATGSCTSDCARIPEW